MCLNLNKSRAVLFLSGASLRCFLKSVRSLRCWSWRCLCWGEGEAPLCIALACLLQAFLVTEPHAELLAPGVQAHGFTVLSLRMGGGRVSPDAEGLSLPAPLQEGGYRLPLGVPTGLAGSSGGIAHTPARSVSCVLRIFRNCFICGHCPPPCFLKTRYSKSGLYKGLLTLAFL